MSFMGKTVGVSDNRRQPLQYTHESVFQIRDSVKSNPLVNNNLYLEIPPDIKWNGKKHSSVDLGNVERRVALSLDAENVDTVSLSQPSCLEM